MLNSRSIQAARNIGDHFKKTMTFFEGYQLFAGEFLANLDETKANMV